jgi:uncharacterized protein YbjT (DUF2867 family)
LEKIMLTGITGFVGSRLADAILKGGGSIRALVRNPGRVVLSHPALELVEGDVRDPRAVREALRGCESAVYLVHGLAEGPSFEHEEAKAAAVFATACRQEGVRKIVYLGGLGDESEALSPHLRSRHLTGEILRIPGIPVTEFRASIVIGRGSTSYSIISALVRRLPFFIEPANLRAECQPIHVSDLTAYLTAALDPAAPTGKVYEIGGPDRLSYGSLLELTARLSGLERPLIATPALEVSVLREAFELICPEQASVGSHLFESLIHSTVADREAALRDFSSVVPLGVEEAIRREGGATEEGARLVSLAHLARVIRRLEERSDSVKHLKPVLFSMIARFLPA